MTLAFERLGAKFRKRENGPPFHSLACHMADTAAVALALWDDCLAPATRTRVANGLGLEEPDARSWVAFLAGLHDLGKACQPFQRKYDLEGVAVRLAGTGLTASHEKDPGHGGVTFAAVTKLLQDAKVPRLTAYRLAALIGAHHGRFVDDQEGRSIGEQDPAVRAAWDAARKELFDTLATVLAIDFERQPSGLIPNAPAMTLAGLVSVADWIASIDDPGFFDYAVATRDGYAAYFEATQNKAKAVLSGLRWEAFGEPPPDADFERMFGFPPRQLQVEAMRVAADIDKGGLVVIEAPMGGGKTEAAFYLVDRWDANAARGFYIALPTMATANQMHERVKRFLSNRFADRLQAGDDLNLILAHGMAPLRELPKWPQEVYDDDGEARQGEIGAGEWFHTSKRKLLAAYGAGTVDQALMAVLQVKHVFVRLFGLAGKAIVIDEVHAYDTYMTGLLERLLEWLGALDAPVVLLSATLPSGRRRLLIEAYARGRGDRLIPLPPSQIPAYPRVSWLDGVREAARGFGATDRSSRELRIRRLLGDDAALRDVLERELSEGGCAAVICNTVVSAQRMYQSLQGSFTPDELGLFHARFRAGDRERIEQECLAKFGPPDRDTKVTACRPPRYVLVATQVVEQSLDLDFDVMVSELAPIDLLLQRSGRLQRHDRKERRYRGDPLLYVRWPEGDDEPQLDPPSLHVYDEHVLLRTWHALRGRDIITIPGDVQDLVDEIYDDAESMPANTSPELASRWHRTWERMREKQDAERTEAKKRRLKRPAGADLPMELLPHAFEEDDPDLHPALQAVTRLTKPSVELIVLNADSALVPTNARPLRRDAVLELLRYSVAVTHGGVVHVLNAVEPHAAFAASPALRRHRLVLLDESGAAEVGPYVLRYDRDLGLRMEPRP